MITPPLRDAVRDALATAGESQDLIRGVRRKRPPLRQPPLMNQEHTMDSVRTFEKIVIIFNPNSSGDAPKLAEKLRDRLTELLTYMADLKLQPTSHAGHAIELAREAASSGDHVLVVSVSGDGATTMSSTAWKKAATRTRSVLLWLQ